MQNCLGALDGTYTKVNMMASDRSRYKTRKGEVATNVLRTEQSEGAQGYHYLCDVGYPNADGFLTPYRGKRYHLQEWRGARNAPSTVKEFFNMKHTYAWNVIEKAFYLLKGRWMMNADIPEDVDEGDLTYVITIGDDIHYIETLNGWINGGTSKQKKCSAI
ncbi:putative nuclease HARBI1 [Cucumis melo var. makuwa]|uniref:Nuclease HARBI1 n=1 Tax=Cucumis melo var. makuwa TaxID=1194695 RepID=A0A5D3DFG2_CUCMM|nr:putative nuclease HARBI1 [Cucumis melo var. makuwa]TYK22334.1 putative nuclease HARBI1 [Cucumis melo var. makuwa]